jgi:PAS domain S-box-containing protein
MPVSPVGKSSTRTVPEPYRVVFDAAPDGILLVDQDGRIRESNPRMLELFGYDRGELEGASVERLIPPELDQVHRAHRHSYMKAPRSRPMGVGMELEGVRKDGARIPVEISLSPFESGDETWVVAVVRDVSERRRLRTFGVGALQAAEDERRRIARELHDDTAQALAAVLLRLRLLERARSEEERRAIISDMHDQLEEAAEGVRRISRGLRPPALEDVGVVAALQAHARGVERSSDLRVEVVADAVDGILGEHERLVLYRVVQEAVTNVVRHSGAGRAEVRVRRVTEGVLVEVEDEGKGFDPARPGGREAGLGLMGMRERAASVGGSLEIVSGEGRGTVVRLRLGGGRG